MDDTAKLLTEIRDLLRREEKQRTEGRRSATSPSRSRSGFERFYLFVAVACVLLAVTNGIAALAHVLQNGYFALAFASVGAFLLVGCAAAVWLWHNGER